MCNVLGNVLDGSESGPSRGVTASSYLFPPAKFLTRRVGKSFLSGLSLKVVDIEFPQLRGANI